MSIADPLSDKPDSQVSEPTRFTSWLNGIVESKGWTQAQLLGQINDLLRRRGERPFAQSSLSKVLSGKRTRPSEHVMRAIGELTGESLETLRAMTGRKGKQRSTVQHAPHASTSSIDLATVRDTLRVVAGHYILAAPAILADKLDDQAGIETNADTPFRHIALKVATFDDSPSDKTASVGDEARTLPKLWTALDAVRRLGADIPGRADVALIPTSLLDIHDASCASLIPIAEICRSEYACDLVVKRGSKLDESIPESVRRDPKSTDSENQGRLFDKDFGRALFECKDATGVIIYESGTFTENVLCGALETARDMGGATRFDEYALANFLGRKAKGRSTAELLSANPEEFAEFGILTWEPFSSMVLGKNPDLCRYPIYLSPSANGRTQYHAYAAVVSADRMSGIGPVMLANQCRRLHAVVGQLKFASELLNDWTRGVEERAVQTARRLPSITEVGHHLFFPQPPSSGDGFKKNDRDVKLSLIPLKEALCRVEFDVRPTYQFEEMLCQALFK